ncbi:myelin protein zero-like protein 2 [Python bivittatus]|uniref:Myelin protein zero-like protein 2 n=1 Tax=Python bivittatus TaxID=176946 RepID=A0A9F3QSA0_PYTBI|nr:myelin protein zero-like protein 2 [Python bivittatus]
MLDSRAPGPKRHSLTPVYPSTCPPIYSKTSQQRPGLGTSAGLVQLVLQWGLSGKSKDQEPQNHDGREQEQTLSKLLPRKPLGCISVFTGMGLDLRNFPSSAALLKGFHLLNCSGQQPHNAVKFQGVLAKATGSLTQRAQLRPGSGDYSGVLKSPAKGGCSDRPGPALCPTPQLAWPPFLGERRHPPTPPRLAAVDKRERAPLPHWHGRAPTAEGPAQPALVFPGAGQQSVCLIRLVFYQPQKWGKKPWPSSHQDREPGRNCLTPGWKVALGPRSSIRLLLLSAALGPVAAVEIHTPGVLEVLNGTNVRLKCTFHSSFPVGQKLTVSWYFQTEMKEPLELVLYYNYQAYPSKSGRFLGRLTWDGNVHKNDASVMLHNVSPKDNGTFQCHVKNPPDVDGVIGEIQLSVVLKVSFSEVHILALTIGICCAAMVTIVVAVVCWRHWRRTQQDKKMEVDGTEQLSLKEGREEKDAPLPGRGAGQS